MLYLTIVRERHGLRRSELARAALVHSGNYSTLENEKRVACRPERDRIFMALRQLGYEGTAAELFEQVRDE